MTLFECSSRGSRQYHRDSINEISEAEHDFEESDSETETKLANNSSDDCDSIDSSSGPFESFDQSQASSRSSSSISSDSRAVVTCTNAAIMDVANNVTQMPVQPSLQRFPVAMYGNKTRSVSSTWYSRYPWVEYSFQNDGILCYACRLFSLPAASFSN